MTTRRFKIGEKTYQVRFISGMDNSDYGIAECYSDRPEIRVRIYQDRTMDGWWRLTDYEAPAIMREFFRLEYDDYLAFCAKRGMEPEFSEPFQVIG